MQPHNTNSTSNRCGMMGRHSAFCYGAPRISGNRVLCIVKKKCHSDDAHGQQVPFGRGWILHNAPVEEDPAGGTWHHRAQMLTRNAMFVVLLSE